MFIYVYNSKYWLGDIFNIEAMYENPNYHFENMAFFHQPTLGSEIYPIAFNYKDKHRFRIGVGFLTQFFYLFINLIAVFCMERVCSLVHICK